MNGLNVKLIVHQSFFLILDSGSFSRLFSFDPFCQYSNFSHLIHFYFKINVKLFT